MTEPYSKRFAAWRAIVWAGIAAGVFSTLAQVLLWLVFTDEFPVVLLRDARLTAALALGSRVLPPPANFDAGVWLAATLIHFALSILYAAGMAALTARLRTIPALLAGAVLGAALYAINLYGFTEVFPWFAQARGWNALAAHIVFGVTAVGVCRLPCFRNGRC